MVFFPNAVNLMKIINKNQNKYKPMIKYLCVRGSISVKNFTIGLIFTYVDYVDYENNV